MSEKIVGIVEKRTYRGIEFVVAETEYEFGRHYMLFMTENPVSTPRNLKKVLYPKLRLTWLPAGTPTLAIDNDRVDLYLCLLTGVICQWGKITNCDIDNAEPYIRRMVKITEDVTKRNIF